MCPGFGGVAILGFTPRAGRIDVAVRTLSECASEGAMAASALWIAGESLATIADTIADLRENRPLRAAVKKSSRVSDVAEYVARIGYPGSWTWTAAHTLAREVHGLSSPTSISAALEKGVPNETAPPASCRPFARRFFYVQPQKFRVPGLAASRRVRVWGSAESGAQICALTSTNVVSFFVPGPSQHTGPWTDLLTKFFQHQIPLKRNGFLVNNAANASVGQRFSANSARNEELI